MPHDWIKSTLGHGNTMCRCCFITDLEAAAIGVSDSCDGASAAALRPTVDRSDDDESEGWREKGAGR